MSFHAPSNKSKAVLRAVGWLARTTAVITWLAAHCGLLEAAQVPHSLARVFHSNTTARQIETRLGHSAAISGNWVVFGAPYDNLAGEDAGVIWVHDAATGALLHRLENPSPDGSSHFGAAVALSGSRLVVGVPEDNSGADDAGKVYVYNLASSTPAVPVQVIPNPNPAINDRFGASVAISGSRVVIGTPGGNSGAGDAGCVYVYDLFAAVPATPVLQLNNPDPAAKNFGHAVAADGVRVVASALQDLTTPGADANRVHVFDLSAATPTVPVLTLADDSPSTNEQFGYVVAISGTTVAVAAPLHDGGAPDAGRALVYSLTSPTPAAPTVTLANPGPAASDSFGSAIAISGNRVVVGMALDDQGGLDAGGACIFDLASGTPSTPVWTLGNPGTGVNDRDKFGHAVAISGTRVVVTAPDDNTGVSDSGSGYLYQLASGTPSTPVFNVNNASPSSHEEFGYSVAISGDLVVVGCEKDDKGASNSGSVSLFNLGSAVPEQAWAVLENPSPALNDYFGVAVAASGTKVVIAAYQDDTGNANAGAVYVYDTASATPTVPVRTLLNPSPHGQDQFGNAVAISGNLVAIGCSKNENGAIQDAGTVYVYDLSSATPTVPAWTLENPLPSATDWFGFSVAISGTKVVVGAPQNDAGASDAGSAYVYDVASATPTLPWLSLDNPTAADGDLFGYAVAISGLKVIIGAPQDDAGAGDAGAGYLFDLGATTPASPAATLVHSNPEPEDYFGSSVAIAGTRVVVGAPEDNAGATDGGCGYVYELTSATFPQPADRLEAEVPFAGEALGYAAAADGTNILLGAPFHDADTEARGAVYLFDPDPPSPEMQVEQPPGTGLIGGAASIHFGNAPVGSAGTSQWVVIRNIGTSVLQVSEIVLAGGSIGDFAVTLPTLPATLPVDGTMQFQVSFAPATTGTRISTLRILSNIAGGEFDVTLTGQALSTADDTDGDGINDVAELEMEAMGFDWQVNDEELVTILRAGANAVGLFSAPQVQSMNPGVTLLPVHPGTGRFKLTLKVEQSADLMNFNLFPVQQSMVTPVAPGELEFEILSSPARSFFRFAPR